MAYSLKIVNKVIRVEGIEHFPRLEYRDFLSLSSEPDIVVQVTPNDITNEKESIIHSAIRTGNLPHMSFRDYYETALQRKIIVSFLKYNTLLLHGAVVSDSVFAFMFVAPSGTGKTTRVKLFTDLHSNFFILNGDKPLIKVEENRLLACGSPWKGKEGYGVNTESPLKAIFLLERSDHTELTELSIEESFDFLVKQTYIPIESTNAIRALKLLKSFDGKVRLFRFRSTPTAESVEEAWHVARNL